MMSLEMERSERIRGRLNKERSTDNRIVGVQDRGGRLKGECSVNGLKKTRMGNIGEEEKLCLGH